MTGEKKQHESKDEQSKKIEISPTQVAGGALASVTAAFLGSHLGVAGTFWGAGLTSVVMTVGGALYQRSLERTKDRANVAAKVALQRAVGGDATQQSGQSSTEDGRGAPAARPDPAEQPTRQVEQPTRRLRSSDSRWSGMHWPGGESVVDDPGATQRVDAETQRVDADQTAKIDQDDKTRMLRWDGTQYVPAAQQADSADERTRLVSRSDGEATEVSAPDGPHPWLSRIPLSRIKLSRIKLSRIKWATVAVTSALVFGLCMLIVTGFEGITGKPLSGGQGGTTVGRVFQPPQQPAPRGPAPEQRPEEQQPSQAPESTSTTPPSTQSTSEPTSGQPMPPGQPTSPETTTVPRQESPGTTEQQQVPGTGAFGAGNEDGQ
jgi:hypothetical protein